ncbi:hypothetical protein JCGZ_11208 [Jatropha curcas]|uniref:Uncharacterized protein n=1 Tax=Jatropha curcas TaxID=180498 RepID=A0A067KFY2_JATCU|nr:hypothetical protein JCGZ_11208 [Jatropha curcas]
MASSDLSDEDFLGSLGLSLDKVNVTADADTHASVTGIYAQATGPLHPGLANLGLPYSIPYYPPDGTLAFREVSLESVDRLNLPPEDITEVPIGLVSQMMELILGMQQELTSSWTLRAFDDQRRRRSRR